MLLDLNIFGWAAMFLRFFFVSFLSVTKPLKSGKCDRSLHKISDIVSGDAFSVQTQTDC